jgi:ABC-type transport system involved in multi-copper enzyme maturation permease subunit
VRRILAVARNTFREGARNKVLYSLLLFAVALIVSALALGELSVHEERRMIRDVGLLGIDLFGVLIAVFLGVNLLYKELALKTVYAILPKPIARWEFVLGKWLGMMALMLVQVAVMGAVLGATLAAHGGTEALDWALPQALWLLAMNVTVVTSVATLFSSFSGPFLSGAFALGLFVVGRSVPDVRALGERAGGLAGRAIDAACTVLPNLHLFYPSGTVAAEGARISVHATFVSARYLALTTTYALGYSALVLALAMLIFRRRDFI